MPNAFTHTHLHTCTLCVCGGGQLKHPENDFSGTVSWIRMREPEYLYAIHTFQMAVAENDSKGQFTVFHWSVLNLASTCIKLLILYYSYMQKILSFLKLCRMTILKKLNFIIQNYQINWVVSVWQASTRSTGMSQTRQTRVSLKKLSPWVATLSLSLSLSLFTPRHPHPQIDYLYMQTFWLAAAARALGISSSSNALVHKNAHTHTQTDTHTHRLTQIDTDTQCVYLHTYKYCPVMSSHTHTHVSQMNRSSIWTGLH